MKTQISTINLQFLNQIELHCFDFFFIVFGVDVVRRTSTSTKRHDILLACITMRQSANNFVRAKQIKCNQVPISVRVFLLLLFCVWRTFNENGTEVVLWSSPGLGHYTAHSISLKLIKNFNFDRHFNSDERRIL